MKKLFIQKHAAFLNHGRLANLDDLKKKNAIVARHEATARNSRSVLRSTPRRLDCVRRLEELLLGTRGVSEPSASLGDHTYHRWLNESGHVRGVLYAQVYQDLQARNTGGGDTGIRVYDMIYYLARNLSIHYFD